MASIDPHPLEGMISEKQIWKPRIQEILEVYREREREQAAKQATILELVCHHLDMIVSHGWPREASGGNG